MEMKQLRNFRQVAKAGSILRAAEELGMSQPALSRQLSAFESEIGAVLFVRSVRGVALTEIGQRLFKHCETILNALDLAEQDIQDAKEVPSGVVTLGAPPSVSSILLRPLIDRYNELFPEVSIHVAEAFSGRICDWVANGEVDIGLIFHDPKSKNVSTEKILQEELYLACPSDTSLKEECLMFSDLTRLNMVLPRCPDGLRAMVREHEIRYGVKLNVQCEVDSGTAVLQLIADGYGYSIMPRAFVTATEKEGRVKMLRVSGTSFAREVYMAWSSVAPLSLAARELARNLRLQAHELVKNGEWRGCTIIK